MILWLCTMEIQFSLPSLESTAIIHFHLPAPPVSWYKITNVSRQQEYLTPNTPLIQLWCARSKLNMDEISSLNIHL